MKEGCKYRKHRVENLTLFKGCVYMEEFIIEVTFDNIVKKQHIEPLFGAIISLLL